jgi:hypothetical protein
MKSHAWVRAMQLVGPTWASHTSFSDKLHAMLQTFYQHFIDTSSANLWMAVVVHIHDTNMFFYFYDIL